LAQAFNVLEGLLCDPALNFTEFISAASVPLQKK